MQDTRLLAECLVDWIEQKDPDFKFVGFYDPIFIKKIRLLIKNEHNFKNFLASISFSYIDFFHNAVYLMPHIFTSHLIEYIRETYIDLNTDLPVQKVTKRSKKQKKLQKDEENELE